VAAGRLGTDRDTLWATPVSRVDITTWYKVIHDPIPTNAKLNRIHMASTDACKECGSSDTLLHRPTECGEGSAHCGQVRCLIARITRTTPVRIPGEWLLRRPFHLCPIQRHRAVLWLLARYVTFRIHRSRTSTSQVLMDYMRRSRWKLYGRHNRSKIVANFLTVLDSP